MIEATAKFESYLKVENGSRLEIWVTGDPGTFVTAATVIDSDGARKIFDHHSIFQNGDKAKVGSMPIESPLTYLVNVENSFHQSGSAAVYVRVVNPEDTPERVHREPWFWVFNHHKPGDREFCGLMIKTL